MKALLCSLSMMLMEIGLLQGSVTHKEIQLTRRGLSYYRNNKIYMAQNCLGFKTYLSQLAVTMCFLA